MAAPSPADLLTIPSAEQHTATVIFVHGLGDSGYGLKPVADKFRTDPDLAHIKWVLPHSPKRKVQASMDVEMPSWFNIFSYGFNTKEDEMGMLQSAKVINQLIAAEVDSGTDPNRIVLGGYSQGATMSLLAGMIGDFQLGGIGILSGWVPIREKFKTLKSPHAPKIPMFWGHGTIDPLVNLEFYKNSLDFVTKELGVPLLTDTEEVKGLVCKTYDGMGHTTRPEELEDFKVWIKKILPDTNLPNNPQNTD